MQYENYVDMAPGDIDPAELSETERRLLLFLARDGRGTPAYIAEELDYSSEHIRQLLSQLTRLGVVTKRHRGLYEITDPEYVEQFEEVD